MSRKVTYIVDTSPIDIDVVDDDGNEINLSATGFDVDLSNSLSHIRKVGSIIDLFTRNPTARSLIDGQIRVTVSKTDFISGSAGWYYVWTIMNDNAGIDQLTHSSEQFEVKEHA